MREKLTQLIFELPSAPQPGFLDLIGAADNITATLVALTVIAGLLRLQYKRTIGRANSIRANLYSLCPGETEKYVESLFGAPVVEYRYSDQGNTGTTPASKASLYNATYGWLTVHYKEDTVLAWGFMLTDSRFHFDLRAILPLYEAPKLLLGRATFTQVESGPPGTAYSFRGPYNFSYSETISFGRNSTYKSYGLSSTMHGWSKPRRGGSLPDVGSFERGDYADSHSQDVSDQLLQLYRTSSPVDSISMLGDGARPNELYGTGGVLDQDDIRAVRAKGPKGWNPSY